MLLEWLLRTLERMFGKRSEAAIAAADVTRKSYESLLEQHRNLNREYEDAMQLAREMRTEMRQELTEVKNELASIRAELERERIEHKECRKQLSKLEERISHLKGQVDVIRKKQSDIIDGKSP